MFTLVAISSGRSRSCLRAEMGMRSWPAPFSTANSATATGLGIISTEPPTLSEPTTIRQLTVLARHPALARPYQPHVILLFQCGPRNIGADGLMTGALRLTALSSPPATPTRP